MPLTIAVVMDPIERVNPAVDTSFGFMLEAFNRGHRVVHVLPSNVGLDGDVCVMQGHVAICRDAEADAISLGDAVTLRNRDADAVIIRTDPPFDQEYLTVSWMLSFAERAGVRCINSPRGLRAANEKLYALEFAHLCPRTIVTNSRERVIELIREVGGEAVVKPVDGHGGFGVFRLHEGDTNINTIIDVLTLEGRQAIIAQEYVAEAAKGDKRLFVIDGELRAAVLRVPAGSDHRSNVHVGGTVEACELSDSDRAIVAAMGDRLREDGLFFVGLDVLGDKLSEVNVTSPTLIRELERLGGPDLAAEVIDALEKGTG